jgi:hypothetical protein
MPESWNLVVGAQTGLGAELNRKMLEISMRDPDWLSGFREGSTVFIASDYSGEHAEALYQTMSFLITDFESVRYVWEEERLDVRRTYLRDDRRMSFKQLRDQQRWQALVPFLRAADSLSGLCLTVAVSSSVDSLFDGDAPINLSDPDLSMFAQWRPHILEKLARVVYVIAVLLAGMSRAGQDVVWITDDDAIAPNVSGLTAMTKLFVAVSSQFLPHMLGHARVGTPSMSAMNESGRRRLEDLVAIPDLVAGAVAEILAAQTGKAEILTLSPPHLELAPNLPWSRLLLPHAKPFKLLRRSVGGAFSPDMNMTSKSAVILKWLADGVYPLKRLVCFVDPVPNSEEITINWLRFHDYQA